MMRRPWVVVVEVPGEGIGEGRHGRAAGVVPLNAGGPLESSCSEDRHKGHGGEATSPGSAGFLWFS